MGDEEQVMKQLYKNRFFHYGSGYLIISIIAALTVSMIAMSSTKIASSVFSGTNSNSIAIQAQEYALTQAEFLRVNDYEDVESVDRRKISNTEHYFEEVIVSPEANHPLNNAIKQKICTVNIYRDAEMLPRYSLRVVKLSKGTNSGLPSGSIIPWFGQLANIPSGFLLCDGSQGTPDLRNRFIVGAGNTYALSATGGADTVKLSAAQMPSHYHYHGYNYSSNGGMWPRLSSAIQPKYPTGAIATKWNGSGGGNWNGWDSGGASYLLSNLITSLPYDNTGGTTAHENRPPYYALYYIMKT